MRCPPPLEADIRIIGWAPEGTHVTYLWVIEGRWRARQVASFAPAGRSGGVRGGGGQDLTKARRVGKNQGALKVSTKDALARIKTRSTCRQKSRRQESRRAQGYAPARIKAHQARSDKSCDPYASGRAQDRAESGVVVGKT